MMNRKMIWSLTALALCGSTAIAEDIYVKSAIANVYTDEGSYYPLVCKKPQGTAFTVVSRDGHWVQVQAPAQPPDPAVQGYVFDDALQPTPVASGVFSGVKSTALVSASAAGRTVGPGALEFANSKNLNPKPMTDLEAYNAGLDPKEFIAFEKQGQVGIGQAK